MGRFFILSSKVRGAYLNMVVKTGLITESLSALAGNTKTLYGHAPALLAKVWSAPELVLELAFGQA
jgi:hypothetical protein